MLHHRKNKKFGRKRDQRAAFLRSLMHNLIVKESIETTEARAKAMRPMLEKLITRSRTDSVANRRVVTSRLHDPQAVKKLFEKIAPRFKTRPGGYLRITKTGYGKSDARPKARIEFVK